MTQMKTSEIFSACIPLLADKKENFICHALCVTLEGNLRVDTWDNFQLSGNKYHEIIMSRLGGCNQFLSMCCSLRDTVASFINIKSYWIPSDEELREFRILWLHSLVAEFQQLGD